MSRGPSPTPTPLYIPASQSLSQSSSATSITPRAALRINTNTSMNTNANANTGTPTASGSGSGSGSGARDRSYSNTSAIHSPYGYHNQTFSYSPSPSPVQPSPSPTDFRHPRSASHGQSYPYLSESHAAAHSSQPLSQGQSPGGARDVALAVRGLRGQLESPVGERERERSLAARLWSQGSGFNAMVTGTANDGGRSSPAPTSSMSVETERRREIGSATGSGTPDSSRTRLPDGHRDHEGELGQGGEQSQERSQSRIRGHGRGHSSAQSNGSVGTGSQDTPGPSASTSAVSKIKKALERSPDHGDTLDLSRRGIERIHEDEVEMFRAGVGTDQQGVWRLALSYNALKDGAIVPSFAQLSRLRYLNLKGNHFTQFPQPLTEMHTLEILDLSKNQIGTFPQVPGSLVNLKVLSLTSNRIYTLPGYLKDFHSLKVFKVVQNPIEWPPHEVLGALIEAENSAHGDGADSSRPKKDEDLRPWIENMKSWMRQRDAEAQLLLKRGLSREEADLAKGGETTANRVSQYQDAPSRPSSPSRSLSGARDHSTTRSQDSPRYSSTSTSRHGRTTSTSSATPPYSATTFTSSAHSRNSSMNMPPPPLPVAAASGHSRGASYTATQRLSGQLTAKKSLPDLRQSHAKIIQDRRGENIPMEQARPLGLGIGTPRTGRPDMPFKPFWTEEMAKSSSMTGPKSSEAERTRALLRKGSADMLRRMKNDISAGPSGKRNSQDGPLIDESRNSYFRRLSTLPSSSISKSISPSLLKFIDAIRGILFALSQLHSALKQYLVFAVNERITGVLDRVMEPAGTYLNGLINALDRFDSMSRRNNPPIQAIRGVIDATKESVAVFAKVIAVLRLQVPALKGNDVRYTRTLLLMIYGSMAEVARSWQAMAPLIMEIRPLVSVEASSVAMRAVGGHKMMATNSLPGRTPISPIPERGESHSPPSVPRSSMSTITGGSPLPGVVEESPVSSRTYNAAEQGNGPRNRRQAGSFSSHDVERGMLMGSPVAPKTQDAPPKLGYIRHRPSESASTLLEQMEESEIEEDTPNAEIPPFPIKAISPNGTSSLVPITPPEIDQAQPVAMVATSSHSARPRHKPSSSSGSSHALSFANGLSQPFRKLSVDVRPATPASATLFDDDLLDVIESATDIAFVVWLRLAEDIGSSAFSQPGHAKSNSQSSISSTLDSARLGQVPYMGDTSSLSSGRPITISPKHHAELLGLLSVAEQITTTLRESLMGLRANPHSYHQTTLPDDAQSFIKTVIRVSQLVKVISANHSFPVSVRQSISKLTQATRECAILIQVSSLRPGSSTPAPMSAFSMSGSVSGSRSASPFFRSGSGSASATGSTTHLGLGGSSEDLSSTSTSTGNVYSGSHSHSKSNSNSNAASSSSLSLNLQMSHNGSGNGSGNGNPPPSFSTTAASSTSGGNGSSSSGWGGLRGLQLPTRMARSRAGTSASQA